MLYYISYSKVKSNKLDARNKKIMNTYKNDMYHYLVNGHFSQVLVPRASYMSSFEHLLMQFNYIITGEDVKKHTKHYAEQYFTEYYKQMLLSPTWSKRVNALTGIFDFRMENLTEEVLAFYKQKKVQKDSTLSYLTIKVLVVSNYEKIFELLRENNVELSSFQYRELMQMLSAQQWMNLISTFEQLNYGLKLSIFDAIALFNKLDYQPFMEEQITVMLYEQRLSLQSRIKNPSRTERIDKQIEVLQEKLDETNELIIRGLKAISIIGHTSNITAFDLFMFTDVWQEKLMIIRLYGKMRLAEKQQFLVASLSDSNYLVRKEAAHSLSLLLLKKEKLVDIYEQLDDQFAKDILLDYISE